MTAAELRRQGLTWREIGDRLGVSKTHARYLADPDYAEKAKERSRAAKRRRTGTCVDCGTTTRYNGRPGSPVVSSRCPACTAVASRKFDYDRIVDLRKRGFTQHEIARLVGCVQAHVSGVLIQAGMGVGRGPHGHSSRKVAA